MYESYETVSESDPLVMNNTYGGCTATSDVVGFCIDYNNCCRTKPSINKCICEHPFVKNCKSEYDNCINDQNNKNTYTKTQLIEKCKSDNSNCCKKYNDIQINSNNFDPPIKRTQNQSILCNLTSIKNLEQKCLELCQTNPECVAYASNKVTCNLYTGVTDYQPKLDMNGQDISNKNVNYYIKRT